MLTFFNRTSSCLLLTAIPRPQSPHPPPPKKKVYIYQIWILCQKNHLPPPPPPSPHAPVPASTQKKNRIGFFVKKTKQLTYSSLSPLPLFRIWITSKKIHSPPAQDQLPPRPEIIFLHLDSLSKYSLTPLSPAPPPPRPPSPPPAPQPPPPRQKSDLENSFTRELKIRVLGFMLRNLLTGFEMLIVPHFTLDTYSVSH